MKSEIYIHKVVGTKVTRDFLVKFLFLIVHCTNNEGIWGIIENWIKTPTLKIIFSKL